MTQNSENNLYTHVQEYYLCNKLEPFEAILPTVRLGLMLQSSCTVVTTAWVKEDEMGSQGHTSTSLLHQSAT
jgi:hypothetical protein